MMNKTRFQTKEEAENFKLYCGYPAILKHEKDISGYDWVVEETQESLKAH